MQSFLQLGGQRICFDRDATAELYRSTLLLAGADECTCIWCKNFAAQRSSAYPEEFLSLLATLGADPAKEWEAFEYSWIIGEPSLYGGWFVFCGELVDGSSWRPPTNESTLTYWFTDSFPSVDVSSHVRTCALEFQLPLPWVLPA